MAKIYLDNSATTRPSEAAINALKLAADTVWGNPSALHEGGIDAGRLLEASRKSVAAVLRADPSEVCFTGSGTLANNTAVFGAAAALKNRGRRIITTAVEHPSVSECMKRLETEGFEVIRLSPDMYGRFSLEELESVIDGNTILVSVMAVNNELGTVNPVEKIKPVMKRRGSPGLLHCDCVQAFGKISLNPAKWGIDLLTASAHKIHGVKGAGALYVRRGAKIRPYILGGGQESGIYSGTEAMPAIAAFGAACGEIEINKALENVRAMRDEFVKKLLCISGVTINSPADALPYIVNFSAVGVPSQTMVNALSEQGIYISAGSACKRGHRSEVITAVGLPADRADSAVRVSLSRYTTPEELDACAAAVADTVRRIRR
ncbi:MAG: cysteine desulfurase [Clostridia bacterium]|nr:cysteine desulfurase [Clostridia bacterium]